MVRKVIPDYRLPFDLVQREVNAILRRGIDFRPNTTVGRDIAFADLQKQYRAVFVAVGAQVSTKLDIPGEDLQGVIPALALLEESNAGRSPKPGERVVVVGGGNVAMDAARTALRLGASEVTVVYRRSRAEMPANPWEFEEAEEEGVKFRYLAAPVSVKADGKKAVALVCNEMRLGEPDKSGRRRPEPIPGSEFEIPADSIIPAIGQAIDIDFLKGIAEVQQERDHQGGPRHAGDLGRRRVRRGRCGERTRFHRAGRGAWPRGRHFHRPISLREGPQGRQG